MNPNSDCELIDTIASILLRKGTYDREFIGKFTEGFSEYQGSLSSINPAMVSRATGLDVKDIEEAAGRLGGKKIAFVIGHGVSLQRYGPQTMDAIVNLALMTGSTGTRGGGFYGIGRENNEIGGWDMGTVPDALPGRQALSDSTVRKHWERAWRSRLSPDPGLSVARMMMEAEKGNLKALYVMGENPVRALPRSSRVSGAIKFLRPDGNEVFFALNDLAFSIFE